MKTIYVICTAVIILFVLAVVAHAQPSLPGDPSQAPIDGGLGVLAAAGGAYALKKLREKSN